MTIAHPLQEKLKLSLTSLPPMYRVGTFSANRKNDVLLENSPFTAKVQDGKEKANDGKKGEIDNQHFG